MGNLAPIYECPNHGYDLVNRLSSLGGPTWSPVVRTGYCVTWNGSGCS